MTLNALYKLYFVESYPALLRRGWEGLRGEGKDQGGERHDGGHAAGVSQVQEQVLQRGGVQQDDLHMWS